MDPQALSVTGWVYARSGDREKALRILNEFAELSGAGYAPDINLAHIYAGLGDKDRALQCLEKACDKTVSWIAFIKVDPKLDPLRSDPRFDQVLRRAGFAV
jgi:hypothetical protein